MKNKQINIFLLTCCCFFAVAAAETARAQTKIDVGTLSNTILKTIGNTEESVGEATKTAGEKAQELLIGPVENAKFEKIKALKEDITKAQSTIQDKYEEVSEDVENAASDINETAADINKTADQIENSSLKSTADLGKQLNDVNQQIENYQTAASEELTAKAKAANDNYAALQAMYDAAENEDDKAAISAQMSALTEEIDGYNTTLEQFENGEVEEYFKDDEEYQSLLAQRNDINAQLKDIGAAAAGLALTSISNLLSKTDEEKQEEYTGVILKNFLQKDEPNTPENVSRVMNYRREVFKQDVAHALYTAISLKLKLDEELKSIKTKQKNMAAADYKMTAGNLVIPDEDYAQAQEHLKTLQGDMEHAAGVYNGLIPQWENARDQFIADKDAYFINQEYSLWELTVVDVQTYYDSKRETTDKNTLVTSLKHYYEIRTALDNTQTTYFDGTENKVIAETLTAENLDEILEIALGGFEANVENLSAYQNLLGNDLEINRDNDGKDVVSPYNEIANPDKGSMGAFYAICRQLWGVNTNNNIIIRYTPVENNEIEDYMNSVDPFYVSDYEPVAYLSYANTEEYETFNSRFENRDTYTQFNQDVEEDYNTYLTTVEEENAQLDEQKAALQKQIDEIQEQIDKLQREQEDIGENQALYRNILNVIAGYYGNATGETQTSYEEALTSLKTMIGEKQEDIVDKQQALTEANAMLEAWTQGLDVEKNEELKLEAVKQYTAQLENDIERLNAKLADEQKKFDIYTAEKDALLAVMIGNSYPEE